MKWCKDCGEKKAHTEFYANDRHSDGLDSYCRECRKERSRQQSEKRKADPYLAAKTRAYQAKWMREYRNRVPNYVEHARLTRRLRREREGTLLVPTKPDPRSLKLVDARHLLPAAPLARWLQQKQGQKPGQYETRQRLADACGVNEKVIRRLVSLDQVTVSLALADHILTTEGSTQLWELWDVEF